MNALQKILNSPAINLVGLSSLSGVKSGTIHSFAIGSRNMKPGNIAKLLKALSELGVMLNGWQIQHDEESDIFTFRKITGEELINELPEIHMYSGAVFVRTASGKGLREFIEAV